MALYLKQSTAATIVLGPFVDDSDGKTAETLLTISQADIRLSKNGAAFAQTNNSVGATHMENGYYSVPLDTTDTNTLGRLKVAVSESGALPVWADFLILAANVYDSLISATDKLDVNTVEWAGTSTDSTDVALVTAPSNFASLAITAAGKVTLITNDDKTGYSLSVTPPTAAEVADAVWDELVADHSTAGSSGKTLDDASTLTAADVWNNATRTITGGTITTNSDKTGYSLLTTPPTAAQIADAVWDEVIAQHLTNGTTGEALDDASVGGGGGSTAEAIWSYESRTLTMSAAEVEAALTGSDITIRRGDTYSLSLTGLGNLTGYTSLWFTIKDDYSLADSEALTQVRKNASGLDDGLIYINRTVATASHGSITVDDADTGAITITLDEVATKLLPVGDGYKYDVQILRSDSVTTLTIANCEVLADYTRTIS
jgi:hypothetical protein